MAPLSLQLAVLYAALGAALAAAGLILISFVAFITAREMPPLHRHEKEKFFLNAKGHKEALPGIGDPPTKQLSVVVPSYNEEKRLPVMMDEALGYLEERRRRDPTFTYEVIVVDDGSKDQTSKVAFEYCRRHGSDKVRVITLAKNRGKGGAVKMGVFSSRGEKILMADADGATRFADVEKLEQGLDGLQPWPVEGGAEPCSAVPTAWELEVRPGLCIQEHPPCSAAAWLALREDSQLPAPDDTGVGRTEEVGRPGELPARPPGRRRGVSVLLVMVPGCLPTWGGMAVACGSRAHLQEESVAQRSYFRTLLMYGFHFLVWFLCVRGIRDTQCGFKLLTREAATRTFSSLHVERWAFDVELLYIAQRFRIPVAEVAVAWTEVEGSKLVPFWSWLQMGRDLLLIRLRYATGAWRLGRAGEAD
ncbi:dolichyl-phosphate beta-glucosyltransferase isoform X1 [Artibeus jamaicensis]|uniref:dolichyl-phosphate beta-glucosyltransferase isoform X1 n=1 Tax=Artibeus jamaicensis TaxID=9417 RepID=UPI00235B1024|nr:dolichyl-phosphate beta-glucosyltransferase isoform X1 [Artibeus jamaicensis]